MQTLYHKPSPDSKDLEFGKIIRHISEIFVGISRLRSMFFFPYVRGITTSIAHSDQWRIINGNQAGLN